MLRPDTFIGLADSGDESKFPEDAHFWDTLVRHVSDMCERLEGHQFASGSAEIGPAKISRSKRVHCLSGQLEFLATSSLNIQFLSELPDSDFNGNIVLLSCWGAEGGQLFLEKHNGSSWVNVLPAADYPLGYVDISTSRVLCESFFSSGLPTIQIDNTANAYRLRLNAADYRATSFQLFYTLGI